MRGDAGVGEELVEDLRRGVEVGARLEQRHDVDRVGVESGELRQLAHGQQVLGRAREAHDVPAAGLGAQAALDVGDGAEGLEDRVGVGGRPLVPDRLERGGVHRRVLADLERGEVEAEGLGLPPEVLELAEGQARGAGGDEGVLHGAEVLDELGGALVAAGVAGASGGEAVRGEAERAPVRRVGQLAGELLGGTREERGVAVEDGAESVRRAGSRAARR